MLFTIIFYFGTSFLLGYILSMGRSIVAHKTIIFLFIVWCLLAIIVSVY